MIKRASIEQDLIFGIKRFEDRLIKLSSVSKKYSWSRLIIFLISVIFFFYFFFTSETLYLVITSVLFIIIFGIITGIQNKIESAARRNIQWLRIKKLHISRMNLRWKDLPPAVLKPDENHPYEFDLSITGEYSIHRLMDTSSSSDGSNYLRKWLTGYETNTEEITNRQQLVKELCKLTRFRDKLSLYSSLTTKKKLGGTKISEWINTSLNTNQIKKILIILSLLIPLNISLFFLYLLHIIPAVFIYSLFLYISVYWINARYTKGLFEDLLEIEEEFGKFTVIFDFLEKYPYTKKGKLSEHCSIYLNHSPSGDFGKIKNTAEAISYTRNPLIGLLLNVLFPYNFFFAYRLEKLKSELKELLPEWLNKWYQLEAYCSLANYAYLNPEYSFPVIEKAGTKYEAASLRHPLIHPDKSVANNVYFSDRGSLYIITGSNMSGKSTYLKTAGINLALAYSGGVVCAENMVVSPFRIQSCIKVSDSVIDGISYFYAEVKKLKIILDELKSEDKMPVFYLIDEIFKGTNNIERLSGSRSYIKEVLKLNGAGLISTHDLELSRLDTEIEGIKNYHFREEAEEGKMIFDYKLHPGPCPTTNALKIMKIEGLPVN